MRNNHPQKYSRTSTYSTQNILSYLRRIEVAMCMACMAHHVNIVLVAFWIRLIKVSVFHHRLYHSFLALIAGAGWDGEFFQNFWRMYDRFLSYFSIWKCFSLPWLKPGLLSSCAGILVSYPSGPSVARWVLEIFLFLCIGLKFSCEVLDPVLVYIEGLHRLANSWNFTEYLVAAQIFHGTRPFGNPVLSKIAQPCMSFRKKLTFDCWLVILLAFNLKRVIQLITPLIALM